MFDPQLPPINVVVQNPPGMSEWAKTLLSASVGFVFAMVASVVMEYAKPWIAKRALHQDMSSHIREEVMLNLNLLVGAMNAIDHVNAQTFGFVAEDLHNAGLVLVEQLNSDRFDLYFADHKLSVYEQPGSRDLIRFYKLIGGILSVVEHRRWISLRPTIHEAIEKGRKYFGDQAIPFVREQTPVDLFFGLDLEGNKITPA